jgi:hypothetical protein
MKTARVFTLVITLALSGCAQLGAPTIETSEYICADEKSFRLHVRERSAAIEIDGMQFHLDSGADGDGVTVFACDMLKFSQRGDLAHIEMEGRPYRENCRLKQKLTQLRE